MIAKTLMSTSLVVVPPDMPVAALAELLAARGISAVPVVDAQGQPLGIVTEGDLIRRLADQPPGPFGWFLQLFGGTKPLVERFAKAHGACARDVMTANLASVTEEASAEQIARLMESHAIRRVLVLRDGRLVGIVSRADLLRAVLGAMPQPGAHQKDSTIRQALLAAMREQPWVDTYWVYPDVTAGVVTLHGYARSEKIRQGLIMLAQGIAGVGAVHDAMAPMPLLLRATL